MPMRSANNSATAAPWPAWARVIRNRLVSAGVVARPSRAKPAADAPDLPRDEGRGEEIFVRDHLQEDSEEEDADYEEEDSEEWDWDEEWDWGSDDGSQEQTDDDD